MAETDDDEGRSGILANDCSLHIMAILQQIDLRAIYAFSRWEADDLQRQEAADYLRKWFRNAQLLRKCLWHAAKVFHTLRHKSRFACFDPFHILIAALVLWAYCTLDVDASLENRVPVRIDLIRHSERQDWIKGDSQITSIHITGLGTLQGPVGARRIIDELHKILLSRTGWTEACHGIAFAMGQVLSGRRPCVKE